jgi:PAP2 superfamily
MDWLVSNGLGWLPWRWALVIATVMCVVMLATRMAPRWRAVSSGAGEVALLMVAYAAWQYAGSLTFGGLDRAVDSGRQIARLEQILGWPSGAAMQAPVLGHEWVMRIADTYYATAHITVFIVTLAWVFLRHREDWPFTRTTIFLTTAACLLIQYKPVAPPRLIPELGVVDTAARTGLSVYDAIPGANQYSAMPSVHIAWSAAVALLVIVIARSPWRWLALLHPVATTWVVVVTGNHYLMDAAVAVVLLAAACAVALSIPSQRPQRFIDHLERRGAAQQQLELDTVSGAGS